MKTHIGKEVINIWRRNDDGTYQTGMLTEVLEGHNTLLGVIWEGRDYVSWMPLQDIALKETYPNSRF